MEKDKIIKVSNRTFGSVGYSIPELHVKRYYIPDETKEITFEELKALYYTEGGKYLIENCLMVQDREAVSALHFETEPEYFYTRAEIEKVMVDGTLNEFLDMLDFAPDGVLELIKNIALELPLNDVAKRDAILDKLKFDVSAAVGIKNTPFDGGEEDTSNKSNEVKRRVATNGTALPSGRRSALPTKAE